MRRLRFVVLVGVFAGIAAACGGGVFSSAPVESSCGAEDAATCDSTVGDTSVESAAFDSGDHPDAGGSKDSGTEALDAPSDTLIVVPHCDGGYLCVPTIPPGFTGPFELYVGAAAPPACGSAFQGQVIDVHDLLDADAAACTCECGAPQDAGCAAPVVNFYPNGSCAAAPCGIASPQANTCAATDAAASCLAPLGVSISAAAPVTSAGVCPPVSTTTVAPVRWEENSRACASSVVVGAADCPAGTMCTPASATPFGAAACIAQTGEVACPASGYSTRHVYYGGVADGRGCSNCACGSVTGASCTGSVEAFGSANGSCSGGGITYILPFSCDPLNQSSSDLRVTLTLANGSCAASAAVPSGTATPAQPTTFCCTP